MYYVPFKSNSVFQYALFNIGMLVKWFNELVSTEAEVGQGLSINRESCWDLQTRAHTDICCDFPTWSARHKHDTKRKKNMGDIIYIDLVIHVNETKLKQE